jgi:hypothetical protein
MWHVEVREGPHDGGGFQCVWHGPCRLYDGLQAPARHEQIEGCRQEERDTRFADNERIPGLDWGGRHDVCDEDPPAGSVARNDRALALTHEELAPRTDETIVRRNGQMPNTL